MGAWLPRPRRAGPNIGQLMPDTWGWLYRGQPSAVGWMATETANGEQRWCSC